MTPEKARQIADEQPAFEKGVDFAIEKACEWLNNNTISTTPFVYAYTASSDNIDKKTFIEQFKKAMKE